MNSRGITYIEVVVAFGLFMIASVGVYAILLQAGHNFVAAREHAAGRYAARSIMYRVRNEISASPDAMPAALHRAAADAAIYAIYIEGTEFVVLLYSAHTSQLLVHSRSPDAPQDAAQIAGDFSAMPQVGYVVIVLVFGSRDQVVGRSYGIVGR